MPLSDSSVGFSGDDLAQEMLDPFSTQISSENSDEFTDEDYDKLISEAVRRAFAEPNPRAPMMSFSEMDTMLNSLEEVELACLSWTFGLNSQEETASELAQRLGIDESEIELHTDGALRNLRELMP